MEVIKLIIKEKQDVLVVAAALLKSGYTVETPIRKVGNKYVNYVIATRRTGESAADVGVTA